MAYITASPNPIAVYDTVYGAYVRGVWDIQDGPEEVRAVEVVVSINGAPSIPFMGPGFFGRYVYPVNLPNTYEFILRYADTKMELTRIEVQTFKGHGEIAPPYSTDIPTTRTTRTGGSGGSGGMEWASLAIDEAGQLHVRNADDGWFPATGEPSGSKKRR